MLGTSSLPLLESWRLRDDLDLQSFGGSWLQHPGNTDLLQGADLALLHQIQAQTQLRALFLCTSTSTSSTSNSSQGQQVVLDVAALAIYESQAQDFLKRLLVLCHITSGQPLRQPELLSVRWRNTDRIRHILLWEKRVLIYTQYHKGQQ
jgi:hypothetical protein